MWTLTLTKPPTPNYYPNGYFPRKYHYKEEALKVQKQIQIRGGQAQLIGTR